MTSIAFTDGNDEPLASAIREQVARRLPAGYTLLGKGNADIIITFDGNSASSPATIWALTWADGSPLIRTGALAKATGLAHAEPVMVLSQLTANGWQELQRGSFAIVPGNLRATLDRLANRASHMLMRALKNKNTLTVVRPFLMAADTHATGNFLLTAQLIYRRLCHKFRQIAFHEYWMTGWVDAPIEASLGWTSCPPVHWIKPETQRTYLADPFAWPGSYDKILCEEYDLHSRRGNLVSLTLKGEQIAQKTPVRTPLSGHLSFPFLFAHEGEVYCLPESSAVRRLMLLRWTGAEFKEHATPLADVAAADSVLFEHEGYFWIAYTDLDIGTHDNLNLCFAKSLSGPWQTHPGNPVTLDPKTARSGGTPFRKDGTLYRPAQDCSETYGGAIRIMRITECTPERYREEEVTRIAPGKYGNPHGFHTLSACSDRCYVDGKRMVFSLANVARKAWRRIRAKVIPYKFLYTR